MDNTVSKPELDWPITLDNQGRICSIDSELSTLIQQAPEQLIGQSVQTLFPAIAPSSYRFPADAESSAVEIQLLPSTPLEALMQIHSLSQGAYAAELLFPRARDIRRRHQLEARLKALYQSQSQMIVILDRLHRVLDFNQQAASAAAMRFGRTMHVGENFSQYVTDMRDFNASFQQALQGQSVFKERIIQAPDGKSLAYEMSYVPIYNEQGEIHSVCFTGVNQDEQRQMRLKLHREQNFIDSILDNTTALILVLDCDGRIERFNRACEALTGYRSHEVVRQSIWDHLVPSEDCEKAQNMLRSVFQEAGELSLSFRLRSCSGQEHTIAWSGSLLDSVNTDERYVVLTGSDITSQLQAESALKKTDAMLLQAQKMEAVGQLTGGIAHDFNNVLTALVGYGQLLESSVHDQPEAQEYVSEILQITQKARELTRQLLTFSRKAPMDEQVFDLSAALAEMQGLLQQLVRQDIQLKISLPEEALEIRMNLSYLQQVMMNLVANARDAIDEQGRIVIHAERYFKASASQHPVFGTCAAGDYARITVQDTGTGMSEHVRNHLFDPFFTTKPQELGTGLGMAVIYRIMQEIGGWVDVESAPEQGSRFELYFPIHVTLESKASFCCSIVAYGFNPVQRHLIRQSLHSLPSQLSFYSELEPLCAAVKNLSDPHLIMLPLESFAQLQYTPRPASRVLCFASDSEEDLVRLDHLPEGVDVLVLPFDEFQLKHRVKSLMQKYLPHH